MAKNIRKLTVLLLCAGLLTQTKYGAENAAGRVLAAEAESAAQTEAPAGEEAEPESQSDTADSTAVSEPASATEKESAASAVYIEPVEDLAEDFIRGMDASAVLAVENSGAKYYNFDGEEQDVFQTLAEAGVNYIRLRVWNDPYDENGNGYGGGNCDVNTAAELGARASQYGMKVMIDFHYSDFWADPSKQFAPKAWENMTADEKADALFAYTQESLEFLLDAGVDVGMVQIGNEINYGMSGETEEENILKLLDAGSQAVRAVAADYGREIQVAVHYTNINDPEQIDGLASILEEYGLDYDIFGISYYPYWHGTLENMQEVAKNISDSYDKQVLIAETAWPYTSEDGDGTANSYDGTDGAVEGYAATVQSQATMVRDVCAAANEAGVIGVFYWEGTWIPVGSAEEDNSPLWETYGSGWATSYAAAYDPDDAGKYYSGCAWENQAMFDFSGHPLASLNVFRYLTTGSDAPLTVDYVPEVSVTVEAGGALTLPETVDVVYNDRSQNAAEAVTWDETQAAAVDTGEAGTWIVTGELEDGTAVTASVEVQEAESVNYVSNPGFEEEDTSMWNVTWEGDSNPTDYQNKAADAYSGDIAFHFWSESDMNFSVEQQITGLEPGVYCVSVFAQGGDMSEDSVLELYARTQEGEQTASFMVTSWVDWQNPQIAEIEVTDGVLTIGVRMQCNAKSWGTLDDFTVTRVG